MKVALAHDYLNQYGGAERVLEQLHDLYPDAPIYTSMYDPNVMLSRLRGRNLAYIDQHLPHLASLLVPQPAMVVKHAKLLLLCNDVADEVDWKKDYQGSVIDLRKDLARLEE